ncbi:MAG: PLP-dependent aminotransferase family protein [Halopseudomonas sp.]
MLSDIELTADQPLQSQLHRALASRISSGRLVPGMRLPSSRLLAQQLGVSRNTVTAVLDQLKAEGYIDSRSGSGVYVNQDLPGGLLRIGATAGSVQPLPTLSEYGATLQQMARWPQQPADLPSHQTAALPFTVGLPDLSQFPLKSWLKIQRRHQDRSVLMGYDNAYGYQPLRQALANYLRASRGVRCQPNQIIITHGAQQALSLCSLVLLNDGDRVMVENPGYQGAQEAFLASNAELVGLDVGPEGLDVNKLPARTTARLMYTTPTHQYPLGGIMPAAQRLKLLDWAARNKLWIIEDDYDSEFHFHAKPIAALQGITEQTPVLYLGSFSKTLLPGLRLGYLVVPESLAPVFARAKRCMAGETAQLCQAVVADFIDEGHFGRHLRRMRQLYQQKWDHMAQLIEQHLAGRATAVVESAGMHLVLQIDAIDDVALLKNFNAAGFGGGALSQYYLAGMPAKTGLVLGFANTNAVQREAGVLALQSLIDKSHSGAT